MGMGAALSCIRAGLSIYGVDINKDALRRLTDAGAAKAEQGEMTVMASGSNQAFDRLQPVLDAAAIKVFRIGAEIGMGNTDSNRPQGTK